MDAFDFDFPESAVVIRAKKQLLPDVDLTFEDHAGENGLTILVKGFGDVELRVVVLTVSPLVLRIDRQ